MATTKSAENKSSKSKNGQTSTTKQVQSGSRTEGEVTVYSEATPAEATPAEAPLYLKIKESVYEKIRSTVGRLPAETGGALGGNYEDNVITDFQYDAEAHQTGAIYSPNVEFLNHLFENDWNPRGIRLLGFVHSHPPGCKFISEGDRRYATRILEAIPELEQLFLPIVMSTAGNDAFEIVPFVAFRAENGVRIEEATLTIIPDAEDARADKVEDHLPAETAKLMGHFDRVKEAYALDRMRRTRLVFVGAGGARSFADDMARTGVGEFVFIDADRIEATNIATQQVRHSEIGQSKVLAIAKQIQDINPVARVRTAERMVDDQMSDAELQAIALAPFEGHPEPEVTVLCGFTDDFYTQARINRFGLHTGHPTLFAQVYREGRGIELAFTHPEVTPACARCALRTRYEAHLKGNVETVASAGTPIFATIQLNALKGFIALALIHHGTDHPRWGPMLECIGARNLILMRLDPDLSETLGLSIFDDVLGSDERILFGDTVWLPQQPDHPDNGFSLCPECGGTGSLSDAEGTFADTREMPDYDNPADREPEKV